MLSPELLPLIQLYQSHSVLLSLSSGQQSRGVFEAYRPSEGVLLLNGRPYSVNELSDIEYTGVITDYKTFTGEAVIDGDYLADTMEVRRSGLVDYLRYQEFNCEIACHLGFQDGKIVAVKLRLLATQHVLNPQVLSAADYLYFMADGSCLRGALREGEAGRYLLGDTPLDPGAILDITRAPVVNETVQVILKDGKSCRGLVTAAQASQLMLMDNGTFQLIPLEQVRQVRYLGTVTAANRVDHTYICKPPHYLHSADDADFFFVGQRVSFVVGINQRYEIAKDVMIDQAQTGTADEYYGILLTVDMSREDGIGFIGKRYVTKASGTLVRGDTVFRRTQMNFTREYNKIYILKYSLVPDAEMRGDRVVSKMEKFAELDSSEVGIVDVQEDGSVHIVPLFQTCIQWYVGHEVDVLCKNGETRSGTLVRHEKNQVVISHGIGGSAEEYRLSFSDIDRVRIIGTVTQYYPNGTGRVDNTFFFHINELEDSAQAQHMQRGVQVAFSLRNSSKGNYIDCSKLRILERKSREVYVISYSRGSYTVVDPANYGSGMHFLDKAYTIPYAETNLFRSLEAEDYHAVFTLQRKAGLELCTFIRTINSLPKLKAGVVTGLDQQNMTISIVPWSVYRKKNAPQSFPLASTRKTELLPETDDKDYEVLYSLREQAGRITAEIYRVFSWYDKCYFGCLQRYYSKDGNDYGFIVPEAYGNAPHAASADIYCQSGTFVNPPEREKLLDGRWMYHVCYTTDVQNRFAGKAPPAKSVWFLEQVPAPRQAPPPQKPPEGYHESVIDLNKEFPCDQPCAYGFAAAYSTNFTVLHLLSSYQNRALCSAGELVSASTLDLPLDKMHVVPETGIKTSRNVYLVRYGTRPGEDGTAVPDETRPVEFLRAFPKNHTKELWLENGLLTTLTKPSSPPPVAGEERFSLADYQAPGEEFGFLVICSNNLGRILKSYEPNYTGPYKEPILFSPQKVRFTTGSHPKNTTSIVYAVRFRREGTFTNPLDGKAYPTLAEGSMVTVVKDYRKKNVLSLSLSEDEQWLRCRLRPTEEPAQTPARALPAQVPSIVPGETVLLSGEDGARWVFCTCASRDGALVLTDKDGHSLGTVPETEDKLWRFGCVTGFDSQSGHGQMNSAWSFSLNALAPALYNIVKAQASSSQGLTGIYCIFRCKDRKISEVSRIREVYNSIPWQKGMLLSADKSQPCIKLTLEDRELLHRRSAEKDPYVIPRIKKGELAANKLAWVRVVSIPWGKHADGKLKLVEEAVDIHAVEQTPVIRYNAVALSYLGYEHETEYYPVTASQASLKAAEGKETPVVFTLSPDGLTLEAYLKGEPPAPQAEEADPETVQDFSEDTRDLENLPLFHLYLSGAGLSQTGLKEINVTEDDLPTQEDASRTFTRLLTINKYPDYPEQPNAQLAAAKIALAYPEQIKKLSRTKRMPSVRRLLLGVLRMNMRNLSRQAGAVYGELAYGLSLLLRLDTRNRDVDYTVWLLLLCLGSSAEVRSYESGLKDGLTLENLFSGWDAKFRDTRDDGLLSYLLMMPAAAVDVVEPALEQYPKLTAALRESAAAFDSSLPHCKTVAELLNKLRLRMEKAFDDASVRLSEACRRETGKCGGVAAVLGEMQRWLKLTDEDDRSRFDQLKQACDRFGTYASLGTFALQERELIDAWRTVDDVEKACQAHPCRWSTELLLLNRGLEGQGELFERLKEEISQRLNHLYNDDSLPRLVCRLNEESLPVTVFAKDRDSFQANIRVIVSNGDSRQLLQPAENICLELQSLTSGVYVKQSSNLDKPLYAGEEADVTVWLRADDQSVLESTDSIELQPVLQFHYTSAFQDGRSIQGSRTVDSEDTLMLQMVSDSNEKKPQHITNPYDQASKGDPLEADSPIYRRRAEEDVILNRILVREEDGSLRFRSGATVMLYGQKKSGKTSLINQIKAYINRSDELRERAIIIDFNTTLSNIGGVRILQDSLFLETFCDNILSKFRATLQNDIKWAGLLSKLQIPRMLTLNPVTAFSRFVSFFQQFRQLDQGRHTVLLFMDEFTTLCTSLVTEIQTELNRAAERHVEPDASRINYLQHVPDFVKNFSDLGFVQVIIGHEAMLRSLDSLGMRNQTAEFSDRVELTVLKPNEADALIREPMEVLLGYNPYRTPLGLKAIEYMKEMSGRHPTFLVRICKQVFDFYMDESRCPASQTQLYYSHVAEAISTYIASLQSSDFDILLMEDGDGYVRTPEERPTYRYLECIAKHSLESRDRRTADSATVHDAMCRQLGEDKAKNTAGILQARHVISYTSGGRIKIETGMFLEYIKQRYGSGGEHK